MAFGGEEERHLPATSGNGFGAVLDLASVGPIERSRDGKDEEEREGASTSRGVHVADHTLLEWRPRLRSKACQLSSWWCDRVAGSAGCCPPPPDPNASVPGEQRWKALLCPIDTAGFIDVGVHHAPNNGGRG